MRHEPVPEIIQAIVDALTSLLGMFGEIVDNLFNTGGAFEALLPLVGLAIAASVIFLAIKVVKKISWGY